MDASPRTTESPHSWFRLEMPYGFALLRILLPLIILESVVRRWTHVEELFSSDGVPLPLVFCYGYSKILPFLPPYWAASLYTVFGILLICTAIGWRTMTSLIGVIVLHTYFATCDSASSLTKFTVIEIHLLLLLCFSGCGKLWSVDAWLARRNSPTGTIPKAALRVEAWPRMLLHFLMGMVYVGGAITKLHTPQFLTGEPLIYWMLSNPLIRTGLGDWMSQHPSLVIISAHVTVLWEAIFLFAIWRGLTRYILLVLGVIFHAMAFFTLGEAVFMLVMFSAYLAMLSEAEYRWLWKQSNRLRTLCRLWMPAVGNLPGLPRLSIPFPLPHLISPRLNAATYAGLLLGLGLVGGSINYWYDQRGIRRADGMYVLQEMPAQEATQLLTAGSLVSEEDKFLACEMGTTRVGGRLVDRRTTFRAGETLVCEASLNPPHEDMFVECHLCDAEGKVITRTGNIVAREMIYTQFEINLTQGLLPGEYYVVFRSRGQPVEYRQMTLLPSASAPVAN